MVLTSRAGISACDLNPARPRGRCVRDCDRSLLTLGAKDPLWCGALQIPESDTIRQASTHDQRGTTAIPQGRTPLKKRSGMDATTPSHMKTSQGVTLECQAVYRWLRQAMTSHLDSAGSCTVEHLASPGRAPCDGGASCMAAYVSGWQISSNVAGFGHGTTAQSFSYEIPGPAINRPHLMWS